MATPFIPNLVLHAETQVIRELAKAWIPQFKLVGPEPTFYCVDQTRGRNYMRQRVITIPKWVLRDPEHTLEYIIHELSHQEDFDTRRRSDHSAVFWAIFKRVCPQRWWHYEWSYKKRATKSAGMLEIDIFSTEDGEKFGDEINPEDV
jgi:hypothetical protein